MDINNPLDLRVKIQKLNWLLKECIGLEEYELCHQIRKVIQAKEREFDTLNSLPQKEGNPIGERLGIQNDSLNS